MAGVDTDIVARADIARRRGRGGRGIGTARGQLLDKGLVEVAGHGLLSFGIPAFAGWIRARA